jgi:heat shock protein HslJ
MKKFMLLFFMLCLAACDGDFKISDVAGKWQLSAMNGQPAPATMREGGITLEIKEDGKFSGQAPVNRYFGQVNVQDKSFKTGPVGSTMMAGPAELMDAERDFFAVINDVRSVDVKDVQLILTGPDGKQLLFVRAK